MRPITQRSAALCILNVAVPALAWLPAATQRRAASAAARHYRGGPSAGPGLAGAHPTRRFASEAAVPAEVPESRVVGAVCQAPAAPGMAAIVQSQLGSAETVASGDILTFSAAAGGAPESRCVVVLARSPLIVVLPLPGDAGPAEGALAAVADGERLEVPTGAATGAVLDCFGAPLDGSAADAGAARGLAFGAPPLQNELKVIKTGLVTGVTAIDAVTPCGTGQSMLVIGDAGMRDVTLDAVQVRARCCCCRCPSRVQRDRPTMCARTCSASPHRVQRDSQRMEDGYEYSIAGICCTLTPPPPHLRHSAIPACRARSPWPTRTATLRRWRPTWSGGARWRTRPCSRRRRRAWTTARPPTAA